MTAPARLLVDLTPTLTARSLEHLVDDVLCRFPTVSGRDVLDTLSRLGPVPRASALRDALDPWLRGPRPQSPPEMELFRRLSESRLGPPQRQFPIVDPGTGQLVARVDLAYPDDRVAIEYNGRRFHGPRQTEADEHRKEAIETQGWSVHETGQMS